jgi:4-amino-4-deoxy-L-arabinose transferase-like glycosyltransferase
MSNQWSRQYIVLLVILCGSACLLLANLGNQYLWEDEAQTALISKTILTEGVPRGYDGKNFFSQENGAEYGENYIWRWHTWLPFYVLAGFYKVFGVSTFVSRLPFVLFGLGTIYMTYILARELWPVSRVPLISAGLLAICVPFILLCRQCRYYSMSMFFTVFSLYAYAALLNGRKYAWITLFVASTLLFHSQHFYFFVLFAAVLAHALIFARDRLKVLTAVIVALGIANGPWMVWLSGVTYPGSYSDEMLNPDKLIGITIIFLSDILKYVFPFWLIGVVLIWAIVRRVKTGRIPMPDKAFWYKLSLLLFFIILNIVVMAATAPQPYFRYIAPSVPLLVILVALVIDAAAEIHFLAAAAVVVLLLATGQMRDYFYEITHDNKGPIKCIASYLNKNGSPDDIVAIPYGDMPLKFYTKMRVIGILTGEDLKPINDARWIILRKSPVSKESMGYILEILKQNKYKQTSLNCIDTLWENREEIGIHRFRESTDGRVAYDMSSEGKLIYAAPKPIIVFEKIN